MTAYSPDLYPLGPENRSHTGITVSPNPDHFTPVLTDYSLAGGDPAFETYSPPPDAQGEAIQFEPGRVFLWLQLVAPEGQLVGSPKALPVLVDTGWTGEHSTLLLRKDHLTHWCQVSESQGRPTRQRGRFGRSGGPVTADGVKFDIWAYPEARGPKLTPGGRPILVSSRMTVWVFEQQDDLLRPPLLGMKGLGVFGSILNLDFIWQKAAIWVPKLES